MRRLTFMITFHFLYFSLAEEPQWLLIIGVVFGTAVVGMLIVLYICRCTTFFHKENEVWKKVADNLVIASPSQIGNDSDLAQGGDDGKKSSGEWQRDGIMARKTTYQRASSRESAQVSNRLIGRVYIKRVGLILTSSSYILLRSDRCFLLLPTR